MARYPKVCEWCHEPFTAGRFDTRFCSDACRQANYRSTHSPTYKALVFTKDGLVASDEDVVTEGDIAEVVVRLRGCLATFSAAELAGPPTLRPACSRIKTAIKNALEREGL